MTTTTIHECESVSRVIARWGSVVAAVAFGVGFVTDKALSYHVVEELVPQIGLVLLVFAGYLLAWTNRFEVLGSALAIFAAIACWIWCQMQSSGSLHPIFLVVAAPALFHLSAVAFHRLRPYPNYWQFLGGIVP